MGSARKLAPLLAALLTATLARADGECAKGYRDTTAEERALMTHVLEVARAALPAAPEGWSIGGYEAISVPGRLCMDAEATPWAYNISRTYNRSDDVAERERAMAGAGAALKVELAARQPRMDALVLRMQELGAELATAAQQGNQARVDAINAELEQLSKQLESLTNEGDTQGQAEAIGAAAMRDVEMSIAVSVNPQSVSNADMQAAPAPAGAQQAFRRQLQDGGIPRAEALVLFGSWRPRPAGGLESVRRGGVQSPAAHAIALRLAADPARIDALLGGIDFGAIAALLR